MAISSAFLVAVFLLLLLIVPGFTDELQSYPHRFVARYFSEYLVWVVTLIATITLLITVTPFGRVRLGADDEWPEFSRFSWFAMLFSAGVGTGILFYGVAEPILHLQGNPFLTRLDIEPTTEEAAVVAQRITLFHWGLHGWAVYSMVGLCLGYFAYRKGLPLTVRSALYPFIGERIYGPIGNTIDLLAIFSALFGIAVSLGLGASQISAGVENLFGIEATPIVKLIIILGVSAVATLSAVSGVSRGIKRLSEFNIWLSALLLGFVLLAGPTVATLAAFTSGTTDYLATFLPMGVWVNPDKSDTWQTAWTLFYWGWWISWGPFVGMFFARISRGRTIREYVAGTLLAPTISGFFCLCLFGATAMHIELHGTGGIVAAVNDDLTQALFTTLEKLSSGWITWPLVLLTTTLIVTWFVTSSDSGTLVITTIIGLGNTHPPTLLRVFWGMMIGVVAGLLLLFGGLTALQAMSTVIGVPFAAVLVLMLAGLLTALWRTERQGQVPSS